MGVFGLMPALDKPNVAKPEFMNAWSSVHAALIFLGYGAFGLSCIAGIMYSTQEHNLKFHKLRAVLSMLPPDRTARTHNWAPAGGRFRPFHRWPDRGRGLGQKPEGVHFFQDAKVVWSAFLWFVYTGLLVMRWYFRQGGRRFAWGAVGTFVFVMLTFWGTNLLSGLHQH